MTVLVLAGAVTLAGCKKKPKSAPPPQTQAPTVTQPEPQLPPTEPTQPPAQTNGTETPAPVTPPVPKPKPAPKKPVASNPPAPVTSPKPNKTVVEGGSATDAGQLSAAIPNGAAAQQRSSTAQLLEATEANLKSITRALSDTENEMVRQIQSYMRQSRLATGDGDTERAYNLALKARLLSDELVKRK